MPGANKYLSLIVFFQREEMSECVNRVSIFTVSSFLWRHSSRKSIYQTLEGASERRWVPSRGILQSWSAGVLERSSSAIVHKHTRAEKILTFPPLSPARVCSPRKFVVFLKRQLPPSFHPLAPLLSEKMEKEGKKGGNICKRGCY